MLPDEAQGTSPKPQPIAVVVREATFLDHVQFTAVEPELAIAFHVEIVPYRWERGVVERLRPAA